MYIPIMKTRREELNVSKNMASYFSEDIIPLFEIINDRYDDKYELDPKTGKPITQIKPGSKRASKIKLPPTEDDIITLKHLSNLIQGKKAFIDFFRFSNEEYKNKKFKDIELSIRLSRDFNYYKHRLIEVGDFSNLIPVISIKTNFEISRFDLINLITELRKSNECIAIRLTDDMFDTYSETLTNYLNNLDYLMLDFREQKINSKYIELEDFQDLDCTAKKIILNSPRLASLNNGDYENEEFTTKIDNSHALDYKDYDLDGFGDFGGLKDNLPTDARSNGTGAALALIFMKDKNKFYSVVNTDTSLGVRGYSSVKQILIDYFSKTENIEECPALNRIMEMTTTYGNWATWNNIILTRYIHQQATK